MTILLQGAEKHETEFLISQLKNKKEKDLAGYKFYIGKFGNVNIIVSQTKVGEINASISTSIGIMKFKPDMIINQGTAGGHSKDVRRGDIVLASEYVQTNSFITDAKLKGEGSSLENWKIEEFKTDDNEEKKKEADEKLLESFSKALKKISNKKVHIGKIASGDLWNREFDRILFLNDKYNTLCEEMETGGVYTTANSFNVPVLSVRIISNNELLQEDYNPKITNECQELIYQIIKNEELWK